MGTDTQGIDATGHQGGRHVEGTAKGCGVSGSDWVTLEEAARLTGKTRGIFYHRLVNTGRARKVFGPNRKWRYEVRLQDVYDTRPIGSGHHPDQWSGPVTEKTLDRLMRALRPIERSVDALW